MTKEKRKRNIYLILSIMWFILILFFSSQSADISSELSGGVTEGVIVFLEKINLVEKNAHLDQNFIENFHSIIRKLAHMFEYMILAILTSNYLFYGNKRNRQLYILSIVFVILAASTDELFQTTIDGRAGQLSDVLIDTSGGVIGLVIIGIYRKIRLKVSENNI